MSGVPGTPPPLPAGETGEEGSPSERVGLDHAIGRLLIAGTYVAVGILALGVVAMLVAGLAPRDAAPRFDLGRLGPDLVALRPHAVLWVGLLAVIATPIGRIVASIVGYARRRELSMLAVSLAILGVIALSITLAVTFES